MPAASTLTTDGTRAAARIAIVVHSLNPGGAQRRLATLANGFAAAGREVDFVALRGGGDVHHLLDPGVRLTILKRQPKPLWKPWMFEGWGRLARWVDANRPDAVLGGITTVHLTALLATRRMGADRPLLALRASRHPRRDFPWSRPFKRILEPVERWTRSKIYNRADLVIAVSRETGDALRAGLPHSGRCVDLPNPVVTPEFLASLDKDPGHPWLNGEVPVLLGVGRLAWQKRFDILLDALAVVRRTRNVRLILLGEGRFRQDLEAQAARLGLADAVQMPGQVADVGAWMARADLLVSTSAFEGSPAVLIEALAAGLPVVATRCPGGSEELLEGLEGSALIPIDDAAATADAIVTMLGKTGDPEPLREVARPYTIEASAHAYIAALDRAMKVRR